MFVISSIIENLVGLSIFFPQIFSSGKTDSAQVAYEFSTPFSPVDLFLGG